MPADQGCCGALHAHNGDSARGARLARRWARRCRARSSPRPAAARPTWRTVLGRDRVLEFSASTYRPPGGPTGEVLVDGRRARVGAAGLLPPAQRARRLAGATRADRRGRRLRRAAGRGALLRRGRHVLDAAAAPTAAGSWRPSSTQIEAAGVGLPGRREPRLPAPAAHRAAPAPLAGRGSCTSSSCWPWRRGCQSGVLAAGAAAGPAPGGPEANPDNRVRGAQRDVHRRLRPQPQPLGVPAARQRGAGGWPAVLDYLDQQGYRVVSSCVDYYDARVATDISPGVADVPGRQDLPPVRRPGLTTA